MYKQIILIIFVGLSLNLGAQPHLEKVLEAVQQNNADLKTQEQYIKSLRMGYRTNLTPANPEVEYNKNFSAEEGKPLEILLKQTFDFPTSYWHRIKIANQKDKNLENIFSQIRQRILLDAKLNCLQLTYLLKQQDQLIKRYENAIKLRDHFQKKMDQGDATILDLNKVEMEVLNSQNRLQLNKTRISELNQNLKKLNGGIDISYHSRVYPSDEIKDNFSDLESKMLMLDPRNKELIQDKEIAAKQVKLSRSQTLPHLSIGYKYINSDFSKQINGMQVGMSIPLWENKNKVKQAKLRNAYKQQTVRLHKIMFSSNLKQLFIKYQSLKESLEKYVTTLKKADSTSLLKKALDAGEISSIEYFLELSYYYQSYDTYLEIEQEYYKTIALINRYTL